MTEIPACIALGANLGDARATLRCAAEALARLSSTRLVAVSPTYRTAPVDAAGPDFFNAVALLSTALTPLDLLMQLQCIEDAHGRERSTRNAPRTLDLDLLLYGDETIALPTLVVPHPRMHQRAFVLHPLLDVVPDAVIPGLGRASGFLPAVSDQRIERLAE